jgi:cytochrome c553
MKRLFVSLVMGFALAAMPAVSMAQAVAKAPAKQKSLAQNGRFHQIHAKKFAMECGTCHKAEQQEVLLQVPRSRIVDRQICVDCHKEGSKPAWYGVVAR